MNTKLTSSKITAKTFKQIEDAVANGATTMKEISAACGIKYTTWDNYLYRIKSKAAEERRDKIYAAIDSGMERLRDRLARAAENSLLKLVEGYDYQETAEEQRIEKVGDGKEKKVVFRKTTTKHKAPNSTAVIFALCNAEGVKRDGRWQSITGTNTDVDISVNMPDGVTIEYDGNLSYD